MPRRRGFLGRIADRVRAIFPGPSPPRRETPEPPPKFAEPPRRHRSETPRQRAQRRTFDQLPGIDDMDDDERTDLWNAYQNNIVRKGRYRFNDPQNPFWSELGIHPRDIGSAWWTEWRRWHETP